MRTIIFMAAYMIATAIDNKIVNFEFSPLIGFWFVFSLACAFIADFLDIASTLLRMRKGEYK